MEKQSAIYILASQRNGTHILVLVQRGVMHAPAFYPISK